MIDLDGLTGVALRLWTELTQANQRIQELEAEILLLKMQLAKKKDATATSKQQAARYRSILNKKKKVLDKRFKAISRTPSRARLHREPWKYDRDELVNLLRGCRSPEDVGRFAIRDRIEWLFRAMQPPIRVRFEDA